MELFYLVGPLQRFVWSWAERKREKKREHFPIVRNIETGGMCAVCGGMATVCPSAHDPLMNVCL